MILDGIKILDLTRMLPGAFCTMFFADFGAEVIRIEQPGRGDYENWPPHLVVNRGKKSLTLNLKSPKGKEIFLKLVQQADVVVESFRPGVMDRLGLGYETIKKENPRAVYCAITGFGQNSPYRDRPGHDINYISIAGLLDNTGVSGGTPVIPGVQNADLGGAIMALSGILMGLLGREKTGRGQMIDISMTDAAFMLGIYTSSLFALSGVSAARGEGRLTGGKACYQVYRTADSRYISIGALEEKFWANLCRAIGRDDLTAELNAPPERQKELITILQEIFLSRNLEDWVSLLGPVDTCFEPVLTLKEAFVNPHINGRGMVMEALHPDLGRMVQLGIPIKLEETPGRIISPAPKTGEHNREILARLGYTQDEIRNLDGGITG